MVEVCPDARRAFLAGAKTSRATDGAAWGWGALAPAWRVIVAGVVGQRTPAEAPVCLERVAPVPTDLSPFLSRDPLAADRTAVRQV